MNGDFQKLLKTIEESVELTNEQKKLVKQAIAAAERAKTFEQIIEALELILSILGVSLKILLDIHGPR
jgi:hypothetical protein